MSGSNGSLVTAIKSTAAENFTPLPRFTFYKNEIILTQFARNTIHKIRALYYITTVTL
jgi:hypothetical protein